MPPIHKAVFHRLRRAAADLWLNGLHPQIVQIAITGSYGKTSTSTAIHHVLASHAPTLMTDLNLDTIYNVPITALKVREHRFLVFELGIDSPGEMDFHLEIVQPDLAVVTGITPVHSDEAHLGSLDAIVQQKRRVIEVLRPDGRAILHYDDPRVREMASCTPAEVIWYGISPACDFQVLDPFQTLTGTTFTLKTPEGRWPVSTPLIGGHQAVNLAAAAAVARHLGVPWEKIVTSMSRMEPLTGRLSVEPGPNGLTVINDALRANPASTIAGLEFLGALEISGQKIAVLGEMGELGVHAVEKHTEVGVTVAKIHPDLLITVGELTRHTAAAARANGMPAKSVHETDGVHLAAEVIQERAGPGDALYIKGSLMRHMERVKMILAGQQVGCRVISCPFYHQCDACDYLENGYNPERS